MILKMHCILYFSSYFFVAKVTLELSLSTTMQYGCTATANHNIILNTTLGTVLTTSSLPQRFSSFDFATFELFTYLLNYFSARPERRNSTPLRSQSFKWTARTFKMKKWQPGPRWIKSLYTVR